MRRNAMQWEVGLGWVVFAQIICDDLFSGGLRLDGVGLHTLLCAMAVIAFMEDLSSNAVEGNGI